MTTYSQMLKGVLDMCLLSVISREETYGYEIIEKLAKDGFTFVSEGSIYPVLLRLQKEGLIEGVMRESTSGPNRKYYHLTEKGKEEFAASTNVWDELKEAVDRVVDKGRESSR